VPPGIIEKDILPEARRDPNAITRRGLKVIDRSGVELDPASVNWARFKTGHIPYMLRQDPGPQNALGRVKFMFPNPYQVYLHDTPSKTLFERAERPFSSGCVRVERAVELAEQLLANQSGWDKAAIASSLEKGKLQNVTLARKMPVLLTYWTAWVDAQDRINFRRDVYGRDALWAAALDEPFKLRVRPLFK
jgi:murein L,D-transpeptidase YcbB/YkuD